MYGTIQTFRLMHLGIYWVILILGWIVIGVSVLKLGSMVLTSALP